MNLELEYYFKKIGRVGVTVFRTDIKNLQRRVTQDLGPDGFEGDTTYAGYLATTFQNIARSHVSGVELDYTPGVRSIDHFPMVIGPVAPA